MLKIKPGTAKRLLDAIRNFSYSDAKQRWIDEGFKGLPSSYCHPLTTKIMETTLSTNYPPSVWFQVDELVCEAIHHGITDHLAEEAEIAKRNAEQTNAH